MSLLLRKIQLAAKAKALAAVSLLFFLSLLGQGAELVVSSKDSSGTAINGTNSSYVLGPNDLIRVNVHRESDLTTETRIDLDGSVFLPLVESVKLGGLTVAAANDAIKQQYQQKRFLVSPSVMVTLVQTARTNTVVTVAKKFTVSGEVKKPGVIEFPAGEEKISLVDAIVLAGDFSGKANKKDVTIKREVKGGETQVFTEDVQRMLRDVKAKRFDILPNDVIEVRQTVF